MFYTSKERMFACCTKVTHIYKKQNSFLSGFDEETLDLSFQVRDKD
jgi:hypothetical protein